MWLEFQRKITELYDNVPPEVLLPLLQALYEKRIVPLLAVDNIVFPPFEAVEIYVHLVSLQHNMQRDLVRTNILRDADEERQALKLSSRLTAKGEPDYRRTIEIRRWSEFILTQVDRRTPSRQHPIDIIPAISLDVIGQKTCIPGGGNNRGHLRDYTPTTSKFFEQMFK